MLFLDDDIFQSSEYRCGQELNFGAVNFGASSRKHELSVGVGGGGRLWQSISSRSLEQQR
jgi:hypothetical protein